MIVCLSMWQPWAYLYCVGRKRIETRDWSAERRGRRRGDVILIQATQKRDATVLDACRDFDVDPEHLHFGGLIGGVVFDREIRLSRETVAQISEEEKRYGDYELGRYGFVAAQAALAFKSYGYAGSRYGFYPATVDAVTWMHENLAGLVTS